MKYELAYMLGFVALALVVASLLAICAALGLEYGASRGMAAFAAVCLVFGIGIFIAAKRMQ